jgi:hypothetical protein
MFEKKSVLGNCSDISKSLKNQTVYNNPLAYSMLLLSNLGIENLQNWISGVIMRYMPLRISVIDPRNLKVSFTENKLLCS